MGSHSKKKSVYIWIFSKPPGPLYFWNASGNFKKKTYFTWTKVPQSVWILVILPDIPWKMSNQKQKKVPNHLRNQATPPPPLPEKFPNSSKKVTQKFWNNNWHTEYTEMRHELILLRLFQHKMTIPDRVENESIMNSPKLYHCPYISNKLHPIPTSFGLF